MSMSKIQLIRLTQQLAKNSTCIRRQIGAVLINQRGVILGAGSNGAPLSCKPCSQRGGCIRTQHGIPSGQRHELCIAVHAEQNAICNAAKNGFKTVNSIMYCTHFPCAICTKIMITAGVIEVNYLYEYPDELSRSLLVEAGIGCFKLE